MKYPIYRISHDTLATFNPVKVEVQVTGFLWRKKWVRVDDRFLTVDEAVKFIEKQNEIVRKILASGFSGEREQ